MIESIAMTLSAPHPIPSKPEKIPAKSIAIKVIINFNCQDNTLNDIVSERVCEL